MRTLQEKYNGVLEGNFSKSQFRRDAAMEMPQFISSVNSFDDTIAILKNKGVVTEAKKQEPKYSTAKPADQIAPDVLDTGIKFELDKKYGTLDVTPEQYAKCREMAIKNLSKDVLYYVKQDSVQLETPGEKMEKVKLNEGSSQPKYSEEELAQFTKDQIEHDEETYRRETSEEIQNIENDEQTKRRIAGLTNQLLKDVDPRDEDHAVKAYAISVKNDLESGDASRLKRYKDLLSIDDLKDDMRHYISHDVDQLEESQFSIAYIQNNYPRDKAVKIQQAALKAVGAIDVQAAYSKSAGEFEQALYRAAHGNLEEDQDFTLTPDEREEEEKKKFDSYYTGKKLGDIGNKVHRAKSPYGPIKEEREALKEMFKKIITKVIND